MTCAAKPAIYSNASATPCKALNTPNHGIEAPPPFSLNRIPHMKPNTLLRRAALIGTAALLPTGLNSCFSPDEVAYQIYTEALQ